MAQVERIEDLQPGDFMVLPTKEWSNNREAKSIYAQAQAVSAAHTDQSTPAPQFQVQFGEKGTCQLERTR